ncbi:MAG: hypothetical protein NW220_08055 [Leptolyngbyaceae cyanobacterium bins.349]|nr:hypothetical protein [Leptolyngbyaceae cyanobacterium bins.349]
MSQTPEQPIDFAKRAELDNDRLKDGASVDEQPESGTMRDRDEVRASSPTNPRLDEKNMEAPEEA